MTILGGKYELGERIGGGGMADVFHSTVRGAEGFSRAVAIKRIKQSISTDKGFAELFIREAKIAAKLQHPNIVQTIDFDRDDTGRFYLVMELIEGVDVRELVKTGMIPASAILFVISEVLRALDYSHEMVADGDPISVVHRDISPHNIMLGWQGSVKVVDYGIAKAVEGSLGSRSGTLKGKVSYMSPEQVYGKEVDGRSDLFAVGIVMHELLRGVRLFTGESDSAILSMLLTKPIPSIHTDSNNLSEDLNQFVMRLLVRDRESRFQSAKEALDALMLIPLASTQGRSDLEHVLSERFPDRAPKRVKRLSKGTQADQNDSLKAGEAELKETLILGSKSLALVDDKNIQAHKAQGKKTQKKIVKRTATAFPAEMPDNSSSEYIGESTEEMLSSQSHFFPYLKRVAALGLIGLVVFWGIRVLGDSPTEDKQGIEVIAVEQVRFDAGKAPQGEGELPATLAQEIELEEDQEISHRPETESAIDGKERKGIGLSAKSVKKKESHPKAKLSIHVAPWAKIEVDGVDYGHTPKTIELSKGKHRVVLRNVELGKEIEFYVRLKSGKTKKIKKNWQ